MSVFPTGTIKAFLITGLAVPLVIILWLFAAGCDQSNPERYPIITGDDSIATVNNAEIPLSVFQNELNSFLQRYRQLVYPDERQLSVVRDFVITRLIEEELIAQEAVRKGVRVTPEEVDNLAAQSLAPYQSTSMSRVLKGTNIDEERWKEKFTKLMVKEKLVQMEVIEKIAITKREIREYYKEKQNEMQVPQAFRVRNITLSTLKEAQAILRKIKKGDDFINLVRSYSISPDKNNDGDLGFIEDGDLPKVMQDAIFKLGFRKYRKQLSGIIEAQDGFHIFKLISHRKGKKLSQRQATAKIRAMLVHRKQDGAYAKWIKGLRSRSKVVIDQAMLNSEQGY